MDRDPDRVPEPKPHGRGGLNPDSAQFRLRVNAPDPDPVLDLSPCVNGALDTLPLSFKPIIIV